MKGKEYIQPMTYILDACILCKPLMDGIQSLLITSSCFNTADAPARTGEIFAPGAY